jgi:hypothetical protein
MKKSIFYTFGLALAAIAFASCDDFLDKMPDSRAELDTEEKVVKMLVSAYPDNTYNMCAEFSSDNVDDYGSIKSYNQLQEELYNWQEVSSVETNENPNAVWGDAYTAIAAANQALAAIEELGGAKTAKLQAAKGEALICRAYAHWVLVNMFCMHYNTNHPDDLGVPYMEHAETELNPKYSRGTVAGVYEKMIEDIETGIPLIDDAIYSAPKYHFNYKAACCFASRVFLFHEDWDNAIKYASMALGSDPKSQLRDLDYLAAFPRNPLNDISKAYNSTSLKANYLISTGLSNAGAIFCNYGSQNRYTHGKSIAAYETIETSATTMSPLGSKYGWKLRTWVYGSGRYLLPRVPYLFEYSDPVQAIGFTHSLFVVASGDEALLNRAEAYIMKKDYPAALADMNMWAQNQLTASYYKGLTEESINKWADALGYDMTPKDPEKPEDDLKNMYRTAKKKLNPGFVIDPGTQENMIHAILFMRRIEFMHLGMRWFPPLRNHPLPPPDRPGRGYSGQGDRHDDRRRRQPRPAPLPATAARRHRRRTDGQPPVKTIKKIFDYEKEPHIFPRIASLPRGTRSLLGRRPEFHERDPAAASRAKRFRPLARQALPRALQHRIPIPLHGHRVEHGLLPDARRLQPVDRAGQAGHRTLP